LLIAAATAIAIVATQLPLYLRCRRERRTAKELEAIGGECSFQPGSPPRPLSCLGRTYARLYERLQWVCLSRNTRVTDAELVRLEGLTGLETLNLNDTRVTDAGLVHLEGLAGLKTLLLRNTRVTNAGLAHIGDLTGLERLSLAGTQVTDEGLTHLRKLAALQELSLHDTRVTEAGVSDLKASLPGLRAGGP
jgi:Leucine-rich repeat (LRR) protein